LAVINPTPRFTDTLNRVNHRIALRRILKENTYQALLAVINSIVIEDIAFFFQYLGYSLANLVGFDAHVPPTDAGSVSYPCQHICNRIT
jgi:hypothetical protein